MAILRSTKSTDTNPNGEVRSIIGKAIDAIVQRFGKGAIMALGGDPGERQQHRGHLHRLAQPRQGARRRRPAARPHRRDLRPRVLGQDHAHAAHHRRGPARRPGVRLHRRRARARRQVRARLGVKLEDLLISQPDCGEQALEIVDTLARTGGVGLIVVDSVAALIPRAELEGDMGDQHLGLQARLMSQAMRKVSGIAHQTNTLVVFINQLRHKIGVTFGSPETTTGGNALKYFASVRLDIRRIATVKRRRGGRRHPRPRQGRQEQVRPALHRGPVRDRVRHRHQPRRGDPRLGARAATSSSSPAAGSPSATAHRPGPRQRPRVARPAPPERDALLARAMADLSVTGVSRGEAQAAVNSQQHGRAVKRRPQLHDRRVVAGRMHAVAEQHHDQRPAPVRRVRVEPQARPRVTEVPRRLLRQRHPRCCRCRPGSGCPTRAAASSPAPPTVLEELGRASPRSSPGSPPTSHARPTSSTASASPNSPRARPPRSSQTRCRRAPRSGPPSPAHGKRTSSAPRAGAARGRRPPSARPAPARPSTPRARPAGDESRAAAPPHRRARAARPRDRRTPDRAAHRTIARATRRGS
jgi:hypothetical protein